MTLHRISSPGMSLLRTLTGALLAAVSTTSAAAQEAVAPVAESYRVTELRFETHDKHAMRGKLVLPKKAKPRAVVIYVQAAEGMTVDMERPLGRSKTFRYFDLYCEKLTALGLGFFSYEGRGITTGKRPPRFETIDRKVYDTSTLDNKVRDALAAVRTVREKLGASTPIYLMGASEGTLLCAEAASRAPKEVAGLALYGVLATNLRKTFAFIMGRGQFLQYEKSMDRDGDKRVTKEEWSAVTKVDFAKADLNKDGVFTVADLETRTKVYLDAIRENKYWVLQTWAKNFAGVSVPKDWFRDHFAHAEIWSFLQKLDIPVGCFHGEMDAMTSVDPVRALEAKAKATGKKKIEFHYFPELEHTLKIGGYFVNGKLPAGHRAIFAFLDRIAPEQSEKR